MAEVGFFIDTQPHEEGEEEEKEENGENVVKRNKEVLGCLDAVTERKQRERAETERGLQNFLFGKHLPGDVNEEVTSDGEEEEEEEEDDKESDLDENDLEDESDAEARVDSDVKHPRDDERQFSGEESGLSEDDEGPGTVSTQPSLPADIFGGALHLGRKRKRKPAWVDRDDEDVLVKDVVANYSKAVGKHGVKETSNEAYGKALARKFKSVTGEPSWAELDREDSGGDSDDEFFRETTELMAKKGKAGSLEKGALQCRKLKDLNYSTHKEGAVIRATEFHPTSTVALVGGNNGTVSLFQVDGKENPKIQTINFQNFPIRTGKFSTSGSEFIVGSQAHPYFYVYDMMVGKSIKVPWKQKSGEHNAAKFEVSPDGKLIAFRGRFGYIHIISARTKEFLKSMKMNDEVGDLKFSKDGALLYSTGAGGEVYVWELRTFSATHKFTDDGCLSGTALALSNHHLATGSSSGVVNVYSLSSLHKQSSPRPTPDKILLNLTTEIESLAFHPSGEAMMMASAVKEGAVKMVHFPSVTVFNNFPGNFNLHRVNCAGFSPGGGYFAVGNNKGAANLYRLGHYASY